MISSVSNSGKPRKTVENVVAHARTQRFLERAATATARPSGNTVMKGNAKKVRRLYHGQVIAGLWRYSSPLC